MIEINPSDDERLMQRIDAGENAALAELYDRFGSRVYSLSYHILQNQALAEEATQDTFMKIWTQATRWDSERGRLVSWLMTIARYTAIDRLRLEKREVPDNCIGLDDMLHLIGQKNVIDDHIWYDMTIVNRLLDHLSAEQRETINLAFFHGLTHREIASYLELPLGTVKSRIRDGLHKLKGLWLHETQ